MRRLLERLKLDYAPGNRYRRLWIYGKHGAMRAASIIAVLLLSQ